MARPGTPAQVGEQSERGDEELRSEVQALAERRFLRTQAVIQDLSDSLLAISDIRGDSGGRLFRLARARRAQAQRVGRLWPGASCSAARLTCLAQHCSPAEAGCLQCREEGACKGGLHGCPCSCDAGHRMPGQPVS